MYIAASMFVNADEHHPSGENQGLLSRLLRDFTADEREQYDMMNNSPACGRP